MENFENMTMPEKWQRLKELIFSLEMQYESDCKFYNNIKNDPSKTNSYKETYYNRLVERNQLISFLEALSEIPELHLYIFDSIVKALKLKYKENPARLLPDAFHLNISINPENIICRFD